MARKKFKITLPNGEVVWITGNTIDEAFANGLKRYGNPEAYHKPSPTLADFIENVYHETYINCLAPSTIATYDIYLKRYILPQLGHLPMNDIKVNIIQNLYNWLAKGKENGLQKNINRNSIERIGGLLERIFRVAKEMNVIDESPMKKTLLRNGGEYGGHHKALTPQEIDRVKRMLPTLPCERQRILMGLLAYTGMRPEEVLGLCWENVDLAQGICEIVQTVTYPKNSKAVLRACAKTETSIRIVNLVDPAIMLLSRVQSKEGFVVHGRDINKPLPYSTYQRAYKDAFQAMNIHGHDCYDFRTTFATECIENGFTSKETADLMGHADTRMVEKVYARRREHGIIIKRDRLNELNKAYAN